MIGFIVIAVIVIGAGLSSAGYKKESTLQYNESMQTWTLDWAIRNFIAELLMPPGIWILMSLGALFFLRHRQILQRSLLVFELMMIWVSSTPAFAVWFTHQMDSFLHWPKPVQISGLPHHQQPSNQTQAQANNQIQAIIVLGGGRYLGEVMDAVADGVGVVMSGLLIQGHGFWRKSQSNS